MGQYRRPSPDVGDFVVCTAAPVWVPLTFSHGLKNIVKARRVGVLLCEVSPSYLQKKVTQLVGWLLALLIYDG